MVAIAVHMKGKIPATLFSLLCSSSLLCRRISYIHHKPLCGSSCVDTSLALHIRS
uniref:Uncharacterized protein n=1 Tax=Triticum urartu TaxID=4572 RepID=A0A8R7R5E4_TRIUA